MTAGMILIKTLPVGYIYALNGILAALFLRSRQQVYECRLDFHLRRTSLIKIKLK